MRAGTITGHCLGDSDLRFTIYDFGFTIYDLRFWIYDYFDPKKAQFSPFSDQNNRKSKIVNPKSQFPTFAPWQKSGLYTPPRFF